jgi:hypothetical protein
VAGEKTDEPLPRPQQMEFLARVLDELEDLPRGLREGLLQLVAQNAPEENRAQAIRELIEGATRG